MEFFNPFLCFVLYSDCFDGSLEYGQTSSIGFFPLPVGGFNNPFTLKNAFQVIFLGIEKASILVVKPIFSKGILILLGHITSEAYAWRFAAVRK